MQATVSTPVVHRVTELRLARRSLAAVALIAGPLLIAALRALVSYGTDTSQTLAAVRAHPDAQQAIQVLGPLGGIAMVFATLCVVRLISRRTPILAAIGGVIAVAGWMMVPMLSASDALTGEIAKQNLASGAALYDAYNNTVGIGLMSSIFIAGHILGMLVLGIAMLRARLTPAWAGIAVIAGTILHPIAFLVLS